MLHAGDIKVVAGGGCLFAGPGSPGWGPAIGGSANSWLAEMEPL